MNIKYIEEIEAALLKELTARRGAVKMWRGELSSSAVSTSVALFALQMDGREKHAALIEKGVVEHLHH